MRHMIPALVGKDPLNQEQIWNSLWSRVFPLAPGGLAAIDIALWDLLGKHANLPVYQLLGRGRISPHEMRGHVVGKHHGLVGQLALDAGNRFEQLL